MMSSRLFYLMSVMLFTAVLPGQNPASYWFFGDKIGLHFTASGIEMLTGPKLEYNEGISSISDCKGELLFYCDAQTIWNRNFEEMANGTGLLGNYSATQGCLIVPHPGDCDLYYIFTQDSKEHYFANGLQYHVVDMRLQNGLGEVVSKNNLLYTPSSEKLTAVRYKDGESIWVISHDMQTNIFRSFLVTTAGLDTVPVLSNVGENFATLDALGQMKASPDGKRIGLARLNPQRVEVFDFDASTGKLSNPVLLPETVFEKDGVYGLEFSPSGDLLYVSNHTINYLDDVGYLYQFDLLAGSANGIANSAVVVGQNVPLTDLRGLQLGPDGRIYAARSLSKFLGVVEHPDMAGLGCQYVDEGLYLGGNTVTWSLPNFMVSYLNEGLAAHPVTADFSYGQACLEDGVEFRAQDAGLAASYDWDFGDGTTSAKQNPVHVYTDTGVYKVRLVVIKNCCSDTLASTISVQFCAANDFYLPNAFSPNGDGINDVFQVFGNTISALGLAVYDRWGERVFESNDPVQGWDGSFRGKEMDSGVFAYEISLVFRDGSAIQKAGSFLLVK
ncbi:MAG: T9SS type B sorting domain-containing protein [Bacteroidetes bacterium]|nr:T9SS type B sorting domain-containing protein [Bacteroidota bacterium]